MMDLWSLEQDTWTWVDDNGFVREEPTGFATFTCSCRDSCHARTDEVVNHAREHIASQHPVWDESVQMFIDAGTAEPVAILSLGEPYETSDGSM
ncbi:hypothetical protein ACIBQ6_22005 [Nonomuraea sp. NPDC049655]|uniref:hypothetical protein n=1 Tax=Nonomuraea sp. NPDC049655 TaxID=3364355 RepID=UPI003794E22F